MEKENGSSIISMTPGQAVAFKNFCDEIIKLLETKKGRDIVSLTASSLRNGIIDKFHLITEQNVKEMLVLHIAALPLYKTLFGDTQKYNPITMILNAATLEILNIEVEE